MPNGETPSNESPQKQTCDRKEVSEETQKRLQALKIIITNGKKNVVEVGSQKIPVLPYRDIPKDQDGKPFFTPGDYYNYLSSLIQTPEDILVLIRKPFLAWTEDTSNMDLLNDAEITLTDGGDCDNIAWAAKRLLDDLSCRGSHNYNARVIGSPEAGHAITVYTDLDGRLCAIDQTNHFTGVLDIFTASTIFEKEKQKGTELTFQEEELYQGIQIRRSIEASSLKRTGEKIVARIPLPESMDFDPNKILPPDWSKHKQGTVFFKDATYFYEDGVCIQKTHSDKTIEHFNKKGERIQLNLANGEARVFREDGSLKQSSLPNGDTNFYDNKGNLNQVVFSETSSSTVLAKFFNEQGKLIQVNFRDKSVDFYNPETGKLKDHRYPPEHPIKSDFYYQNGATLKQRVFTVKTAETPYRIIFYDPSGKAFVAETWEGKTVQNPPTP